MVTAGSSRAPGANRGHEQHEARGQMPVRCAGRAVRRVLVRTDGANGRKGSRNLIFVVDDVLHVVAARVGEDAAVAERARAPLEAALEPADHLARGASASTVAIEQRLLVVEPPCTRCPASRRAAPLSTRRRSYSGPSTRAP